ncbi:unnamed protein product [Adineta steineri]|uniref:NAD(P)(+)--arginine ADP-ribosyltransferase n=1 Tax=Adineta steineri TaxID=433720 RepID=A0A815CL44_9BILA|nr:unnamed protein product [Adineta steineri]CAF1286029.1 unnamed protein product [Adineta steineri]CAF1566661.1 unnamed protein product [Adineta steineri]CAF1566997.1 unnamed protein product [Adineta steineri]
MDPKPSQANVKSSRVAAASYVRQPQQRMTLNYLLLWVDTDIDLTDKGCQNTLTQLKNVVNDVNLCTEPNQCIQVLNKFDKERAFVIVSGSLGQHLVPKIHSIPKLDTIYIFCGDQSRHEGWAHNWTKIKGVHANIKDICQALQLNIKQSNQNSIAMSFVTVNEMTSTNDLNQLEPTFMYTQLFKEILLNMEHNKQTIEDFITYCRHNNCGSTTIIDRFEQEYHPQSAIQWYTFTPFIYCMLNDSLRWMESNTIIKMGFFIRDLHEQIQLLYQQQAPNYHYKPFVVYRGQGLSKASFEKLQKSEGALISFNNFLSTSIEQNISLVFARSASENADMVGILFIMFINPCIKSTPFASIKDMSYFKEEEEILFSMHTVFRVNAVKQMDNKNQLYQVELQLTTDDDQQLRLLTDRIREEVDGTGWQRLGNLLLKIGQFNEAEELYNVLLEQTYDESQKQHYYNQLGYAKDDQGDYEKAIWYYEQGLEICQKTLPSNHSDLATSYNNIGLVYDKIGEYSKALSFYVKALDIREKALPSNHPDFAQLYSNIGGVYHHMREYSKALSYLERALDILQRVLPPTHLNIESVKEGIEIVKKKL